MKFTVTAKSLQTSLSHANSVVERRNTIAILGNVMIEAQGETLRLSATDMDLEVVETLAVTVQTEGAITVPAHMFYDIVRKFPADAEVTLTLSDDGNNLNVSAGRSVFHLSCLPREEFPEMSGGDMPHQFILPATSLRSMIDQTRFAISNEETRFYLNGLYLHPTRNNGIDVLRAVATDGHRLARTEVPLPEGAGNLEGIIIPRKAIAELRKLIDGGEQDVTISASTKMIRFTATGIVLTSKLIDAQFPEYEKVIPANNDKTLNVDPQLLARAVDRVSTVANESNRGIKLTVNGTTMTLSASGKSSDSAKEELEVNFDAGNIDIGFNARYLLDVMQQIPGESCRILLADSGLPAIIQNNNDDSALYVLMPMRV